MASFARGNPARWWKSRACGGASRAPLALFVSPFRRWAGSITLIFLILLVVGGWYMTRPARISRLAEVLLSRVLGGDVTVRTGRLSFSGTLLLSGVEVRTPRDASSAASPADDVPIFSAEQIEARFDWMSLMLGQLTATQLVADSPVFRPIENRDADHDRWNYELLRPAAMKPSERRPGGGKPMSLPVVLVRNAIVEWGEVHDGKLAVTARGQMEGEFTPDPSVASTYRFELNRPGAGNLLRGTWDTSANMFIATAKNIDIADALHNGIPRPVMEWFESHQITGPLSEVTLAFNPHDGPSVSADLGGVSMVWMVEPEQGVSAGETREAYPLDVKNVYGRLEFSRSDPAVRISDLHGEVLGQKFIADCTAHGLSFDAPFELKLRFPGLNLKDPYPPLFMAFLTGQDLLARVNPLGKMDIAMTIRRTAPRAALLVDGTVDCHDAQMRFAHFPFPLDHMNGRISFDQESVAFHGVKAKADEMDVKIDGMTGTTWSNRMIDFTVTSPNAAFDDRMAACLPSKYKTIWDMFSVQGTGAFVCTVKRGQSLFELPRVVVDVDLHDGSGFIHRVPYAFDRATGHLHFEADQTRIDGLVLHTGKDDSGKVIMDGVVRHPSGDVTHLQPDLHIVADVPLEAGLIQALPAEYSDKVKGLALGGRAGFNGEVQVMPDVAGAPGKLVVAGDMTWRSGTLKGTLGGAAVAMETITGQGRISPEGLELQKFTAEMVWPGAAAGPERLRIGLTGKLDNGFAGDLNLSLLGEGISLPEQLPEVAPAKWKDMWSESKPAGQLDLFGQAMVKVNAPAVAPAAGVRQPLQFGPMTISDYKLRLVANGVKLGRKDWPADLEKMHGTVDITPATIAMSDMSAVMDGATLRWQGSFRPDNGAMTLSGEMVANHWPGKLIEKLPAGIAKNLDAKRTDSSFSLTVESLAREGSDKAWDFEGSLKGRNVGATGPMAMTAENFGLAGKGRFDPEKAGSGEAFDFDGKLSLENLNVSDHIIDTLTADVAAVSAAHEVTLNGLTGSVAGGQLHGMIRVRTAGEINPATEPATTAPDTMPSDGGYRAELTLSDAEFSKLVLPVNATEEERKKIGDGRVNASLSLQQTFGPNADRTGRGEMTIDDGKIFNVPLSMGLMQVATLRLPVADSFDQASLSYYLRNDQVTFERILLESKGINLAGLGTLSIKDKNLEMSFITETPHEMYVPILTPIIQATRDQLLQVSVTGTLANPKIVPVPLSAIAATLKNILPRPRADAAH